MNNNDPTLQAIGINIPEFMRLWKRDLDPDKSRYRAEVAYIYHMVEYDSPYYDRPNKHQTIAKDYMKNEDWEADPLVLAALKKYESLDSSSEKRTLDSAIMACESVAEDLKKLSLSTNQIELVLAEVDTLIAESDTTIEKVELLKQKMDLQKEKLNMSKLITDIFPRLEKHVSTIISLRAKVTKAVYKGETSGGAVATNFLLDKLNSLLDYEQMQNKK